MRLIHARVLDMEAPLGIDANPYFSWEMQSEQNNSEQECYQLIVKEKSSERIVWNSGKIVSKQHAFVPYEGEKLESKTLYEWTVNVQDNHGINSAITSCFETAYMDNNLWISDWAVSDLPVKKREKGFGKSAPATMFRKSFAVHKEISSARLYVTCHGIYRLTINGTEPDSRVFAPEYTSYHKYLCYQIYDVKSLLTMNENIIGMMVGDGWYFGLTVAMDSEDTEKAHAVLFQLEINYVDGSSEMIHSSEDVKTSYGPIISSDLFGGELYDARKEISGWNCPGFDDSDWKPAKACRLQNDNLVAQPGEPVLRAAELPVKKMYISPKGETILDFGQNFAGYVKLKMDVPANTEISLDLFEVTDCDGNYYNNILASGGVGEGVDQKITYISNGKEAEYEPYFMFSGFRFARVTGLENVKPENFTGIAVSSDKLTAGTFECSYDKLNQLYSNICWSQRSNMLSIPTDCPQREKAGWTGDIGLYAKTALLNGDLTSFLSRWLDNVAVDQAANGAVPMVVPFNVVYQEMSKMLQMVGDNEGDLGIAGWGDAVILVPFAMYEITGNVEILKKHYQIMKSWCDYIIQSAKRRKDESIPEEDEQYLWNTGFHYGEWLIPSTSKSGMEESALMMAMAETGQYIAPLFGWNSINRFAQISTLLGHEDNAVQYGTIADSMKGVIKKYLVKKEGKIPWNFMGAYVLMLHFNMVEGEEKREYLDRLIECIHENNDCLDTGFLATPFLLDVLSENGYQDLAYTILFQTKAPSWLYEVEHDATTIWESCMGYDEAGNPLNISMNHYSFGAVAEWMFKNINGIRSDAPGFDEITICPKLNEKISYAKRSFFSKNGEIVSDWKIEGSTFYLYVKIPCNTKATVEMPNGDVYQIGSGDYNYSCQLS